MYFNMSAICLYNDRAVTWLRPLLDELLTQRIGFDSILVHVKFLLNELAVGKVADGSKILHNVATCPPSYRHHITEDRHLYLIKISTL